MEHGYQPDSTWVTRPLLGDETIEIILCGHSERLALAWNFVVNPNAIFIQITKNLRICGDCRECQYLSLSPSFPLHRSIHETRRTHPTL
jgi:hypothetical protein